MALIPLYVVIIFAVLNQLFTTRGFIWIVVYLIAVGLALLPAHLFEFRYFTPGVVIAFLNISSVKLIIK